MRIKYLFLLLLIACGSSDQDSLAAACGGLQGLQCAADEYCKYEVGSCGADDLTGVCEEKSEICTEIYQPVCGCDDKTYANACNAAGAGVSLVKTEACSKELN